MEFFQKESITEDVAGQFILGYRALLGVNICTQLTNGPTTCAIVSPRNYRGKYTGGEKIKALFAGDVDKMITKVNFIADANGKGKVSAVDKEQAKTKVTIAQDAGTGMVVTTKNIKTVVTEALAALKKTGLLPQVLPTDDGELKALTKKMEDFAKMVALSLVGYYRAKGVLLASSKIRDAATKGGEDFRCRRSAPQAFDMSNIPIAVMKNLPKGCQGPATLYTGLTEMMRDKTRKQNDGVWKKMENCLRSQVGDDVANLLLDGTGTVKIEYRAGVGLIQNTLACHGHRWNPLVGFCGIYLASLKDGGGCKDLSAITQAKYLATADFNWYIPGMAGDVSEFGAVILASIIGVIYSPMEAIAACIPSAVKRKEQMDWKAGATDAKTAVIPISAIPRPFGTATAGTSNSLGGQKVGWNSNRGGANTTLEWAEKAAVALERTFKAGSGKSLQDKVAAHNELLNDKRFFTRDLLGADGEIVCTWDMFFLTTTQLSHEKYQKRKAEGMDTSS